MCGDPRTKTTDLYNEMWNIRQCFLIWRLSCLFLCYITVCAPPSFLPSAVHARCSRCSYARNLHSPVHCSACLCHHSGSKDKKCFFIDFTLVCLLNFTEAPHGRLSWNTNLHVLYSLSCTSQINQIQLLDAVSDIYHGPVHLGPLCESLWLQLQKLPGQDNLPAKCLSLLNWVNLTEFIWPNGVFKSFKSSGAETFWLLLCQGVVTDPSPQSAAPSSQDASGQQPLSVETTGDHATAYSYQQSKWVLKICSVVCG